MEVCEIFDDEIDDAPCGDSAYARCTTVDHCAKHALQIWIWYKQHRITKKWLRAVAQDAR